MTRKLSVKLKTKSFIMLEDWERFKAVQLLGLINKRETVKVKWLEDISHFGPNNTDTATSDSNDSINENNKNTSRLTRFHVSGMKNGKVILVEKSKNSNKSFLTSSEPSEEAMVFVMKKIPYLSPEMIVAGLYYNKEISTFKLAFFQDVLEKPLILVYMRKDSSTICDFIKTHHRAFGPHSLNWEKLRRLCFLPRKSTFMKIKHDDATRVVERANVWTRFKLLKNSNVDENALCENTFPMYMKNLTCKRNMRAISRKKAEESFCHLQSDRAMLVAVEYFRHMQAVRDAMRL